VSQAFGDLARQPLSPLTAREWTEFSETTAHSYLEGTGFSDDEIVQRLREGGAMVVGRFSRERGSHKRRTYYQRRRPFNAIGESPQGLNT
jgi:hypothetical protein